MNLWDHLCEATVDAFLLDPVKKEVRIDLTIAWGYKPKCKITASGVEGFLVNEMSLSNIVDRAIRYDAENLKNHESDLIRRLFFLMRGKSPEGSELEWPALKKKLAWIRSGVLTFLEIEPVYGANILILAQSISLEEEIGLGAPISPSG